MVYLIINWISFHIMHGMDILTLSGEHWCGYAPRTDRVFGHSYHDVSCVRVLVLFRFLFWHQYNRGASFCTPPSSIFQLALWIMVILNNNGKTNTQSHHLLSLNNRICSPTPLSTQCVNFDMLLPIVFFAPWIFDNPKTIDLTFVIMGWVLI